MIKEKVFSRSHETMTRLVILCTWFSLPMMRATNTSCLPTTSFTTFTSPDQTFSTPLSDYRQQFVSNVLQGNPLSADAVLGYVATLDYVLVYSLGALVVIAIEFCLFGSLFQRTHRLSCDRRLVVLFMWAVIVACFGLAFFHIVYRLDDVDRVLCHTQAWVRDTIDVLQAGGSPHQCLFHLQVQDVESEWMSFLQIMLSWNLRLQDILRVYKSIVLWVLFFPHILISVLCISLFLHPRFVKTSTMSIFVLQLCLVVFIVAIFLTYEFSQDVIHWLEHFSHNVAQESTCTKERVSEHACRTIRQCKRLGVGANALNASFYPIDYSSIIVDGIISNYTGSQRALVQESFTDLELVQSAQTLYRLSSSSWNSAASNPTLVSALAVFGNVDHLQGADFTFTDFQVNITRDLSYQSFTCAISSLHFLSTVSCSLFSDGFAYLSNGIRVMYIHFWLLVSVNLLFSVTSTVFLKTFLKVHRQTNQVQRVPFGGLVL